MTYDIILGRSEEDKKKYGSRGTIFLAKQYIQMGQVLSLSNKVYMDVVKAHAVLVCGKRGGGKCLTGDTIITLSDGSQMQIKDLEDRRVNVMSLNSKLKIKESKKVGFFKRKVDVIHKVKLRSGKEIKLTPEHPLLTIKGWKPTNKLKIGSRIATPRKIPSFGDLKIEEYKIKIIAYLAAEGHLGNNFILFSNLDPHIVNDFKDAIYGFDQTLKIKIHSSEGCYRIVQHNKKKIFSSNRCDKGRFKKGNKIESRSSLRKWIDTISFYGKKAHQRILPNFIFNLSKKDTCLFLNRLFSCDGSIHKDGNRWRVSYSTSSKILSKQIHHLLLKVNIISRIRNKKTKKRPSFELIIGGTCVRKFIEDIGFFGRKKIKCELALQDLEKINFNPNIDTIPKEIWDIYRPNNWAEIGRAVNYSYPKSFRESQRYAPSRQKLCQIAKTTNHQGILNLAKSDIFWDEIISMEKIEGDFNVYDFSVPENHNFIANDIIVHNSYTLGVIAEGMCDLPPDISKNLSCILLDTMGIYWTMKYPNHKDSELLKEWGLKGKSLDIKIFTPIGYYQKYKDEGIPTDFPFSLSPIELTPNDWCLCFGLDIHSPIGVAIESSVNKLNENKKPYSIQEMIDIFEQDSEISKETKKGLINRFTNADKWGLFDKNGTKFDDLVIGGSITVLDVSCYATVPNGWEIKSLVIGLVAKKLFIERMISRKEEEFAQIEGAEHYFRKIETVSDDIKPLIWLVIDEAHEFLKREGSTAASDPLITILREGRQPGISLICATQQPGKIHTDVMTQSDIVISHRLTAKLDTDALSLLTQTYMHEGLDKQLNMLPATKGSALILDDQNERVFSVKVRPRFSWHGGEAPIAIPKEKKF